MKIKEILSAHRNDFTATLVCEHCNSEQHLSTGYMDAFYHNKVIPSITCKSCKKDRLGNIQTKPNDNGFKSIPH